VLLYLLYCAIRYNKGNQTFTIVSFLYTTPGSRDKRITILTYSSTLTLTIFFFYPFFLNLTTFFLSNQKDFFLFTKRVLRLFLSFRIFVFHEFGVFNEELKKKKNEFYNNLYETK